MSEVDPLRPDLSGHADRPNLFDRPLPPGYRDELQALIADLPPEERQQTGSTLVFQLGELRLALPTHIASAVAPVLHVARIPHRSGTVLLGLAAFRGEILPCCSLSRLLDLPQAQTATPRTLILEESAGRKWAVPIDGVLGVRTDIRNPMMVQTPVAAHWIKGSYADEAGMFHLLDHDVLFRQITLATA